MDKFLCLNLIGKSPAFLHALALIEKFAGCDATVMILGETGTGKELAARAIHYLSPRSDLPFVPVNCGAVPDSLAESELFGHIRGAFTDARETRLGLIAQARNGTLFLDEIETMSPRLQAALLRFLEDKEYRPVGGDMVKNAGLRVIGSSNANMKAMVQKGLFRSDLLFRLNVLTLNMPPLRARSGDVVLLAQEFLDRMNNESARLAKTFHPDSLAALNDYEWPGNIRELENLIQREFLLADGCTIKISNIGSDETSLSHYTINRSEDLTWERFKNARAKFIAHFEKSYLTTLLAMVGGNLSYASRLSGKDRSDLSKLLKKHGLEREHYVNGLKEH